MLLQKDSLLLGHALLKREHLVVTVPAASPVFSRLLKFDLSVEVQCASKVLASPHSDIIRTKAVSLAIPMPEGRVSQTPQILAPSGLLVFLFHHFNYLSIQN